MSKSVLLVGAAILAGLASAPAHAELLNFDLTGSRTATFQLDSNPTPSLSSSFLGDEIVFFDVIGTFGGVAETASAIDFGTGSIYSALSITAPDIGFAQFGGPAIFSGTAAAPIFSVGSFNVSGLLSGASTLTISAAPVSSAPEPSTWALLLTGVAMLGAALRSARRRGGSAVAG